MTYRDALHQVAQGADPATAFAEFELEAVSPDALSSALRHFAETSPIEVADLLSPFLARTSPVPFEAGDLEPLPEADDILARGGGIDDLLSEIGLDPTNLDVGATIDAAEEAVADAIETAEAGEALDTGVDGLAGDDTFGSGGEQADVDADDALDVLDEIGRVDDAASDRGDIDTAEDGLGVDTETFAELLDEFDRLGQAADVEDLDDSDVPDDFDLD